MFFKQKYPYRLLTPGPVPLHPEVRKILNEPMLHHRTPAFEDCLNRVIGKLKTAFGTNQNVFIHTSTGSGAMESAVVNTLSPGQEVLCIVSGKFGERWAKMCEVFGMKVHTIQVPWGEAVQPLQVEKILKDQPQIRAVLTQACETSTATIHPIRELAQLVRNIPQTIFMVDAITAIGAMPLEMDEWGLDVVIGGSQKAFMLPTGLGFIAISKKAWSFVESSRCPKFYWDIKNEYKSLLKGETHFSSSVPLIRALDLSLNHLIGTEKSKTLRRIESLAQATREAFLPLGFKVYSKAPSPSVTALLVPDGVDSQKMRDHIEEKFNITLMGGQDQLKGKILRVGHLGYILDDDMYALSEALYQSIREFGNTQIHKSDFNKSRSILKKHLSKSSKSHI